MPQTLQWMEWTEAPDGLLLLLMRTFGTTTAMLVEKRAGKCHDRLTDHAIPLRGDEKAALVQVPEI